MSQRERNAVKRANRRIFVALAASTAVVSLSSRALASDVSWNVANGAFELGTNWVGNNVPSDTDRAFIDNGGVATLSTFSGSVLQFQMGSDPGKSGTLIQSGGTFDSATVMILGDNQTDTATPAGDGTYNMSGGVLTVPDAFIGNHGQGTFIFSGGTITSAAHFRVGRHNGGTGFMNMTGGVLTTPAFFLVAENGGGSLTVGTFNISGGTMTCANYNIGQNTNGQGTVHQSGGWAQGTNIVIAEISRQANLYDLSGGVMRVASTGTNTSGGTVFCGSSNGIGELRVSGTGEGRIDGHIFAGSGSNSLGTFSMSGGTVNLGLNKIGGGFLVAGEFGTATVNISGGVFNSDFWQQGRRFNTTSRGQTTQTGGSVTVRRTVTIGGLSPNENFLDISGGTFSETNDLSAGTLNDTEPGIHVARFSVNPGTFTAVTGYSKARLTISGTAAVNIAGGLYNSTGLVSSITLDGGGTQSVNLPGGQGLIEMKSGTLNAGSFLNGGLANAGSFNGGGASATYNQTGGTATVGAVTGTGAVNVSGGTMNVTSLTQGTLAVSANGTVNVAPNGTATGTSRVNSFSVTGNGKVDLADNDLIIDYTGSSPLPDVRTAIASAYGTGNWTGNGLTSSKAATSPNAGEAGKTALGYGEASVVLGAGGGTFSGQSVDDTAVLVKYTYGGDANLDGQVDVTDLGSLATNWQTSGPWTSGDFNYDGFVDVTDLGSLATNWQAGVSSPLGRGSLEAALDAVGLSGAAVPEPLGLALLSAAAPSLLRRRRRRVS